ncbi:hypothetical protein JRO89_XS07G0040900 [Xanthoceras sorbifolium]|uniref:Uncharacterized protein n=1 Tax=Xanthoceras sorbifolium TaxID=99658 RepID=A0ABQ8HSM7_9ROSI|nr:hypothetical protein JRO89_XS07G0040900 [Xanthoceras sorbifolium]
MANKAASYNWENPTKKELWGGDGGTEWNYQPNGPITEIIVSHGYFIDAISFKSVDGEGKVHSSDKYGGDGGTKDIFEIHWPNDYLESISGTYDTQNGEYFIRSLRFKTKQGIESKSYGHAFGKRFEYSMQNGIIVGFYGRRSNLLDAIGVYVKPYANLYCLTSRVLMLREERDIQPAHLLLNVKSYSLLPIDTEERGKYESKFYEFEGYNWKLILFPHGDKANNDGHISLFLAIDERTLNRYNNSPVYVDLKFFVLNKITNKYLTIRDTKGALMVFDKSRTVQGFSQLISLDEFQNSCNGYLVDDACAFGAEFFIVQPPSRTRQETVTLFKDPLVETHNKDRVFIQSDGKTHTWEITQFLSKGHEEVRFNAANRTWFLHIFPKGKDTPKGDFMTLYLHVNDPSIKVYVKATVRVLDQLGNESKKKEETISRWYDETEKEWDKPDITMLLSDIRGYVNVKGSLLLQIKFDVISEIK